MQHSKTARFMTGLGQHEKSPLSGLCLVPPAADIPLHEAMSEKCHSTKSLRDSGGMWLVRSVFPTVEIVGSRCCLEDRVSTLSEMLRGAQLDR